MRKIIFLIVNFLLVSPAMALDECLIAKNGDKTLLQTGQCEQRYSPASTFKIAISLMGYDTAILLDRMHPVWPYNEKYHASLAIWKQPHNPTTWLAHSCVWYSQVITQKLGFKKFKDYVKKFQYGNKDVSGDKGLHNGLTQAWLSSSLQISPQEEVSFLQKLLASDLPVSKKAQEMTRNILYIKPLPNGWKLYGKTGGGQCQDVQRNKINTCQMGWFVGWLQKEKQQIIFVHYKQFPDNKAHLSLGLLAEQEALDQLDPLMKK
ncbi:MAG: class D beta-lactamase [Rickettsia endosymbiont of Ixodes persulcatus]|nr:class D beta-lactamase [Rickettsia endosymbiont of Ixodes persulcatus]